MLSGDDTDYDTLPTGLPQTCKPSTKTYAKKAKHRATRSGPAVAGVPRTDQDSATTSSEEEETTLKGKGRVTKGDLEGKGLAMHQHGGLVGEVGGEDRDHVAALERAPGLSKQEKSTISTEAQQSPKEAGRVKTPVREGNSRRPPRAGTRTTRLPRSDVQLGAKTPATSRQFPTNVPSSEQMPSSPEKVDELDDALAESARTSMRPRSKKLSALSDKSNLPKQSQVTESKTRGSRQMPSLEIVSLYGSQGTSESKAARPDITCLNSNVTKTKASGEGSEAHSTMSIFHDPRPVDADVKKDKKLRARSSRTSSKSKAPASAAIDHAALAPVSPIEASSTLSRHNCASSSTLKTDGTAFSPHLVGMERGGYGQLPPPIVPIAAGTEDLSHSYHPSDDDLSGHSSIVIETYETTERHVSDPEEGGNETIRAAPNVVILNPSASGHEALDLEGPDKMTPAPVLVDDDLTARVSSRGETSASTELQTTEARSAVAEPLPATKEPEQPPESEFLTPGQALPPRRRKLSLAQPRPGGPGSDEDDLAYYLAITATGSSGEEDQDARDQQEWLKGEAEVGKGVEPGWTIEQAQRRRYILRKLPGLGGEKDSDDELTLRGEFPNRSDNRPSHSRVS
ncbi:BQ2448_3502 [Microbotryum intermedium]|uniref:BQ2448_3502 protein n=1 Tax=Microbotryum intermedium TaxID=269621 RepID=A0A238FA74_9BASI|nr:BQ2448_3502 [Microbotryum intermedium]